MNVEMGIVFVTLLAMIVLFASDRFRLDLIALSGLMLLLLLGILSPAEAFAGFSDALVLMIAGLFVVGAGIFRTGLADALGRRLESLSGRSLARTISVIMLMTALLSAFISSTGTVAVLLPVVVSLAKRKGLSVSALLIPLAFASLLGGMLTLIGTPPNLVVSNQLVSQGLDGFAFFDFFGPGILILFIGIGFMASVGWRLLPQRKVGGAVDTLTTTQLADSYAFSQRLFKATVPALSPLAGVTIANAAVRQRFGVTLLALSRNHSSPKLRLAHPESLIGAGEDIYLLGEDVAVEKLCQVAQLDAVHITSLPEDVPMAELVITSRSSLLGNNPSAAEFRKRFGVTILGLKRGGKLLSWDPQEQLREGDMLLVVGRKKDIANLRTREKDVVIISEPAELRAEDFRSRRAPFALAILTLMLVLMTFGIVANVTAVMLAALLMVLTGCVTMRETYRSISSESVVLIAAILPVATALENTGAIDVLVGGLVHTLGEAGPYLILLILFLLTSLLSQVISNTATAVLVAPVAYAVALGLDVNPKTLLMVVAIAASTAFATPVASPVNTLVFNPGNYKFSDFLKVGVALQLLVLFVTLLVVPVFFPF
jgi:di/tricarboxylate transporter